MPALGMHRRRQVALADRGAARQAAPMSDPPGSAPVADDARPARQTDGDGAHLAPLRLPALGSEDMPALRRSVFDYAAQVAVQRHDPAVDLDGFLDELYEELAAAHRWHE